MKNANNAACPSVTLRWAVIPVLNGRELPRGWAANNLSQDAAERLAEEYTAARATAPIGVAFADAPVDCWVARQKGVVDAWAAMGHAR